MLPALKPLVLRDMHKGSFASGSYLEGHITQSLYFFFYSAKISVYLTESPSFSDAGPNSIEFLSVKAKGFVPPSKHTKSSSRSITLFVSLTCEKFGIRSFRLLHSRGSPRVQYFRFHYRWLHEVCVLIARAFPRFAVLGLNK